jgi:hypothetical protein
VRHFTMQFNMTAVKVGLARGGVPGKAEWLLEEFETKIAAGEISGLLHYFAIFPREDLYVVSAVFSSPAAVQAFDTQFKKVTETDAAPNHKMSKYQIGKNLNDDFAEASVIYGSAFRPIAKQSVMREFAIELKSDIASVMAGKKAILDMEKDMKQGAIYGLERAYTYFNTKQVYKACLIFSSEATIAAYNDLYKTKYMPKLKPHMEEYRYDQKEKTRLVFTVGEGMNVINAGARSATEFLLKQKNLTIAEYMQAKKDLAKGITTTTTPNPLLRQTRASLVEMSS